MASQDFGQGNFGGGYSETVMHPIVAIGTVAAILLIMKLPRKYAIVPFLLAVFLFPVGQELLIGGFHLYVPRILIPFGLLRLAIEKSRSKTVLTDGWNDIDRIFLWWALFRAIAPVFLFWGNKSAFNYQLAFLWDVLGGYFVIRYLIRDKGDITRVVQTLAVIAGILGLAMVNETVRDQNIFGFFGSVPLVPAIRDGKIRSQGPFEHPLLAGSFAATVVPLFLWLWHSHKGRLLAAVGLVGATAMVITSSSSTPLLAYLAVLVGLCFWPLRGYMRLVRWGLVCTLIACHLMMKAPVWFLIAHVDLVAGNSGYHRAALIDSFIRHFSDWWLIGTDKAATWGYEMDDLCNQWIAEGETGGLAALICFIMLVSHCFSRLGRLRAKVGRIGRRKEEWFLWFLGIAMFSHCVAYFGISYFDQTKYSWIALLCIISVATAPKLKAVGRNASNPGTQVSVLTRDEEMAHEEIPAGALVG